MTDTLNAVFAAAHNKAVDFAQADYDSRRAVFDEAAAAHGYRLAGYRLGRAVFTSKEKKA